MKLRAHMEVISCTDSSISSTHQVKDPYTKYMHSSGTNDLHTVVKGSTRKIQKTF